MSKKLLLAASVVAILSASPAFAADDANLNALRAEIAAMKQSYETRIDSLENRLKEMESTQATQAASVQPAAGSGVPATEARSNRGNAFNPDIGVVLNGKHQSFSSNTSEVAGFALGEEGERGDEGLGLDETELSFSANVDDKFRGSATIALHEHGGETEVEIEEAYVETMALPGGLKVKAGRFLAPVGYLNEHHSHADDFVDRPLPNRAFLDKAFNDDGAMVSWLLPTDFYTEIGAGGYRGDDFPSGGGDGNDIGAWNAYARTGGDFTNNTAWRLGLSTLQSEGGEREAGEGAVIFDGDSDLYVADARFVWAPTGNNHQQEVTLQGEYFYRDENGMYEDTDAGTGAVAYDDHQSGWYAQSVYKFSPQWRIGARYSELNPGGVPAGLAGSAIDDGGHDPWAAAVMGDWSNSEFSRLRLQYNHEDLAAGQDDNQFIVQYIMSIGAHGAHPF